MIARILGLWRLLVFNFVRLLRGGSAAARFLGVKVGDDCRIFTKSFGSEPWLVEIGSRVTVTSGVLFVTHDGAGWLVRDDLGRRFRYARIAIGNNVFIGVNSILLPGVRVGDRVVIAAGSVVTKSVPSGFVVAGNPASVIMSYDEFAARVKSKWSTTAQMTGKTFEERVDSVAETYFKTEMKP